MSFLPDETIEAFGEKMSPTKAAQLCLWMHQTFDFLKPITEAEVSLLRDIARPEAQDN
jgi:hypothetical protein